MGTPDRVFHRKLSFDVVGCAQKAHRVLGPGFPEGVHHKALCFELIEAKIPFESEKLAIPVNFGAKSLETKRVVL